MNVLFVLGAADPEMEAIETLLTAYNVPYAYAVHGARRVRPGNAYRAERAHYPGAFADDEPFPSGEMGHEAHPQTDRREVWVECGFPIPRTPVPNDPAKNVAVTLLDHHHPGDPGFGLSPSEFFYASSLGQVLRELVRLGLLSEAQNVGRHLMIAAADHCLGAAYRGECPGVDPRELGTFRADERARFQGRDVSAVLADIAATTEALRVAKTVVLAVTPGHHCGGASCGCCAGGYGYGGSTRVGTGDCHCSCGDCLLGDGYVLALDMRSDSPWAELTEAATRAGVSYISGPLACPDGRRKITCSGTREVIDAFTRDWAPDRGLVDIYGDPARGFAGGYVDEEHEKKTSRPAATAERA